MTAAHQKQLTDLQKKLAFIERNVLDAVVDKLYRPDSERLKERRK